MKLLFVLAAASIFFTQAASGQPQPPGTWDNAKTKALQEPLLAGIGGRQLRQCLLEKKTAQDCVMDAVRHDFIPALPRYASELDWLAKQKNATPAACITPKDMPLPMPRG